MSKIVVQSPQSNQLYITQDEQAVVVNATTYSAVTIISEGPQGPSGNAAAAYIHSQVSPSDTWTITHNLGFKPIVELLNSGSQEIDGDVIHISYNITMVYFTIPVAGFARLI